MLSQTLVLLPDGTYHSLGQRDLFGATVNPPAGTSGYPGKGPLDLSNAAAFDAALGVGPVAMAVQKAYLQTLPQVAPANIVKATQAGMRVIVCCQPPQTMAAIDESNFAAFLNALLAAVPTGSVELVLWQEPNTSKHFSGKAALYKEIVAFYGEVVRELAPSVPLVYDPAMTGDSDASNPQSVLDFLPDPAYVDEWLLDYYLTSDLREKDPLGDLNAVAAVADPLGIPLGIGEFNVAASTQPTSRDDWETFADMLLEFFYGRLQAGMDNAELCFWMGEQSGAPDLLGEQVVALRRLHAFLAA